MFCHNYNYYYTNKNILVWYSQVDDSPDSDEEVIDVEETLAKLQDVSNLFDEKNNHYNELDNESVLIKQVKYPWSFLTIRININGFKLVMIANIFILSSSHEVDNWWILNFPCNISLSQALN